MDVVVKCRKTEVSDRFREHVTEKLGKLERLDAKVIRVDVEVSREHNPRQAGTCERVELTIHSKGPVVRAEACADDKHAALDLAVTKLGARLRRSADRRRVHHGTRTPVSVAEATAALVDEAAAQAAVGGPAADGSGEVRHRTEAGVDVAGDGPLVVREKTHAAGPMSLEQALYEMELVGHDFYLFVDAASSRPSVVYRRHGYDYGVIHLDLAEGGADGVASAVAATAP